MAVTKTVEFLPEVFRTDTNQKFLNATLDQLISEPNLTRLNGYIGRRLAPSYKKNDNYIEEVDKNRQNYQLEPSVVIKNTVTGKIDFATTYIDIINKINYYGGLTNKHDRLFDNEYYTFDPRIDLDKFVNFSQYYWLQNGPLPVTVSAAGIPLNYDFTVTYDSNNRSYKFSGYGDFNNPIINLARGGSYQFIINEQSNNFWIQSKPGLDGYDPNIPSKYTRNVLGVDNNGEDIGVIKFTVPTSGAQSAWTSMTTAARVDYATSLSYRDVQGASLDEINYTMGGLDGVITSLHGRKIIFIDNGKIDDEYWANAPVRVTSGIVYIYNFDIQGYDDSAINFDAEDLIPMGNRNDVYEITVVPDEFGTSRIVLTPVFAVVDETKIIVTAGERNTGKEFYSRNGLISEVPDITASLNTLFYQSGIDNNAVGQIQLFDIENAFIDPDNEIIGKKTYTSPNGIVFSNGLKVLFDSTATESYANKAYYVANVGIGIQLIEVDKLICPELDDDVSNPDYLTIKINSLDQNAWSRSNRWFHSDIIKKTAEYNDTIPIFDQNARAQRPIIEFDENLQLYNFGVEAKDPIDVLDIYIERAHTQVQGVIVYIDNLEGTVAGTNQTTIQLESVEGIEVGMTMTNAALFTPARTVVSISGSSVVVTSELSLPAGSELTFTGTSVVSTVSTANSVTPVLVTLDSGLTTTDISVGMTVEVLSGAGDITNGVVKVIESTNSLTIDVYDFTNGAIAFACANNGSTDTVAKFRVGNEIVTIPTNSRIIFSADLNDNVRNKIYDFTVELVTHETQTPVYKAYFQEAYDANTAAGHTIVVKSGVTGKKQWHYNGSTWKASQLKNSVNQAPLFDIVDKNGISFSDSSVYNGTSFSGTKLFSYKRGGGYNNDSVLGFPLSYKNFVSQGDILFSNDFDHDEFSYLVSGGGTETFNINLGFLQKNLSRESCLRQNIWTINENFSKQFQIYNFIYDGTNNIFPIDNIPELSLENPNVKVSVNNRQLNINNFAITQVVDRYAILINPETLTNDDIIFVSIYSNAESPNAYYEVPVNFDINSLNTNLENLTLGQLRNHLITMKNNSLDVIGDVPGASNLRDIQYKSKGGSILQHSAPLIYAGLFLNHPNMNFVNSLKLANKEYTKFKIKFIELAGNLNLDINNISGSVDTILLNINSIKNDTFPWYHSDMVPYGTADVTTLPTYTILNTALKSYEISNIYNDGAVSNKSVLVYLTREVDNTVTKTLLIKNKDFYFNQDRPAITFYDTFNLLYGDKINIVEYNNTDGSYIPETPTKLGLFPRFIPQKYLDDTYVTPINVIQGHDGSIIPAYNDFRDDLLLELEKRIYNNIKVIYDSNIFNIDDYKPGKFRITDYSLKEFNQILSQGFLSWAGTNKIDYTTNDYFVASNPFTWNYKNFKDGVNGETLPGTWRAIYRYFYDTDRPHTHPWEMLGFSEKPDYWDDRYGPAPYTGGNDILWSDLSLGYIHAGSRQGFDVRYQRANLSTLIPVDDSGNLKNPTDIFGDVTVDNTVYHKAMIGDFDSSRANLSYGVGDLGPAELAWYRSSEFPYYLNLAMSLIKPAKYFALCANVDNYSRNNFTGQFLVKSTTQHINPISIPVHGYKETDGSVVRGLGYVNWIRDYLKNLGIGDPETIIKENLNNLNVQLSYKLGGYTDKKFIELLAEQNSPSSINDSIIIPDENYLLELYKGSPTDKIIYSAVIIEKSSNGYTVNGYDTNNPFFNIIPSQPNNNAYTITVGSTRATVYKDFKKSRLTVPYGYEFSTKQQIVDFLVSYQRFLEAQGFIFDDRENALGETKNFILSSKEFLHWADQGWKNGSIIILSPVNVEIKVYKEFAVVDEIKNTLYGSRVLDINNKIIIKNNFTVKREDNIFKCTTLSDQTFGLAEFDIIQYEHLLVLDNITVFQDVIYLPELGNRQYRLKLIGNKTANWNGGLELPGFIYTSGSVDDWLPGVDYSKGTIIRHKSKYYTALQNVVAADQFQVVYWQQISVAELKSGMVNNFATNAQQGLSYYDIDNQPRDEKLQLFSNGLIGFRNRNYFNNLGIDTTTQSKFYQGFIKQKGTNNALIALKGGIFSNLDTEINIYENWAVRVGEYGATDVNKYIEIVLDESRFNNNPVGLQFIDSTVIAQEGINEFSLPDIYKRSDNFNANVIYSFSSDTPSSVKPLPVAGFVHMEDVDNVIFDISKYQDLTSIINQIGTGYKIWVAKDFNNDWNVYRASTVPGIVFLINYNIDDLAQFTTNQEHGLEQNDVIVLKSFNSEYQFDGVYRVHTVVDSTRFFVILYQSLDSLIEAQTVIGNGILFKLTSVKINYPYEVDTIRPVVNWVENDKVWVNDIDGNKNWGVYNRVDSWKFSEKLLMAESQYTGSDQFGSVLNLSPDGLELYVSAPSSGSGRVLGFAKNTLTNQWVSIGFVRSSSNGLLSYGKSLSSSSRYLIVGCPESQSGKGSVYIYKDLSLYQIIFVETASVNDNFGASSAISDDGEYLYIGSPGNNSVLCFAKETRDTLSYSLPDGNFDVFKTVPSGETTPDEYNFPDGSTGFGEPDGIRTKFPLLSDIDDPQNILIYNSTRNLDYVPYHDYDIVAQTNAINNFTYTGTAVDPSPLTYVKYYNLSATGGSGSGAIFNVIVFRKGVTPANYYLLELVDPGSSYAVSNTLTIAGTSLGGASPANDITITVTDIDTVKLLQFSEAPAKYGPGATNQFETGRTYKIQFVGTTNFVSLGAASNTVGISFVYNGNTATGNGVASIEEKLLVDIKSDFYTNIGSLPIGTESNGVDNFGISLKCNRDGSTIVVGANTLGNDESGAVFVYNRTITEFISDGISGTYSCIDKFNTIRKVRYSGQLFNPVTGIKSNSYSNELLTEDIDYYIVNGDSIQFEEFNLPVLSGRIVAETNQFVLTQTLLSTSEVNQSENFGTSLAMCNTGCNLYVTSPNYRETHYAAGKVTRFVNVGRVFGEITGKTDFSTVYGPAKNNSIVIGNTYRIVSVGTTNFTLIGASTNTPGTVFVATGVGTGTGTVVPAVTPNTLLVINNYPVVITGSTLADAIMSINSANLPGIRASDSNNKIYVSSDITIAGEKLNLKAAAGSKVLDELGLLPFRYLQVIKHPEQTGEVFGTSIAVDQVTDTLIIGSEGADMEIGLVFDAAYNTVFDSGSTTFSDKSRDSGAGYVFNLMTNPYETEDTPSIFTYTQKLQAQNVETGFNFGYSVEINNNFILAGVPNDPEIKNNGGSVFAFYNEEVKSGWHLLRYKQPTTDFESITSAFIYSASKQNIIEFFDVLDPAKGKILGVVDQELDYKEEFDPASYNNNINNTNIGNATFYWTSKHIGRTWWDLSTVKFIEYEQDTLQYRINNWGGVFPNSEITIYEWVESDFLPSQYVASGGDGIPKYIDDSSYSSTMIVDAATGIITQKYFYWVKDKTTVDANTARRTLSTTTLEKYIANPKDQGIAILAPISLNAVSLYNISNYLSDGDIIFHLETALEKNSNLIHNEYQLVQQGNPTDSIPLNIISKLRDSLVGSNLFGQIVPDPTISAENRVGILLRPRQSIFVNRVPALKTFVTSVNLVFAKNPIFLISNASLLYAEEQIPTNIVIDAETSSTVELEYLDPDAFYNGYKVLIRNNSDYSGKWTIYSFNSALQKFELQFIQSYKTSLFWDPTDWYSASYIQGKEVKYTVETFANTQTLILEENDYVKILDNGNGQWLIFEINSDLSFTLIAAQNATVTLKQELYDSTLRAGFDSVVFDLIEYDPQAVQEISNIFNSVYSEIFINDLKIEFNNLFFNLVNYIFSEQKNPDWIFKTSFIDVYHNLRTLEQLASYTKDDQDFYQDYINEAKPYRTIVREYIPQYTNKDFATGNWTDFDLVSKWDSAMQVYRSPDINNDYELISNNSDYSDWLSNYTYKIVDFIIADVGELYSLTPEVEIIGGGGSGATAFATIDPGTQKLTGVFIINPGSGYTSLPTVLINGVGRNARVYPKMANEFTSNTTTYYNTIRNIKSTLKFDRIDYTSNITIWSEKPLGGFYPQTIVSTGVGTGNLWISGGNLVVYNNETFAVNQSHYANLVFDYSKVTKISSSNVLLKAVDRITSYYTPTVGMVSKEISQLMYGASYPGSKVTGSLFSANSFSFTSNVIGFDYTGLRITSANIEILDFEKIGFDLNQPIRIEALVPFDFANNGIFKIIGISRNEMMLTGAPIETVYNLIVGESVTANVGDYITQANSIGNAIVAANVTNSTSIPIIYTTPAFTETANVISINGVITGANVQDVTTGGILDNVKIENLYIDDVIDSNIYSTYLDSALGTRPEDIILAGGSYVDMYSSHAPEELIPGRAYDTLEMRVFTNNSSNTETYGFRIFQSMNANVEYTRIANISTVYLTSNLSLLDTIISVSDASLLPDPGAVQGIPGQVFINGEKIHYYQKYDTNKIQSAVSWTANTFYHSGELLNNIFGSNIYLVLGNVYANSNSYINTANIQLVTLNTLAQIRRGVDGTGSANIHLTNSRVVDTSLVQKLPNIYSNSTSITGNVTTTNNVSWKITTSQSFTANIGDYLTQFVGNTGNARIIGGNVQGYKLYLDTTTSQLAGNIITQFGTSNASATILSTITSSNVLFVTSNSSFIASGDPIYINNRLVPFIITKVQKDVITANVFVVDFVNPTANLKLAANVGTRVNLVSYSGFVSNTVANIISIMPAGQINANGNVTLSSVTVTRSNLFVPLVTGVGLEGSTSTAATFIRDELSYIP